MSVLVSASVLAADKTNLIEELKRLELSDVDLVHFDVMDNVFVPNTSFNDDTFDKVRKHSNLIFEIHLMVNNPFDYINNYFFNKDDVIIVHYESFSSPKDFLDCILAIKEHHRVGVSIKPKTSPEVLIPYLDLIDYILIMSVEPGFGGQSFMHDQVYKIEYFSKLQKEHNYKYLIEVDGGINNETCKYVKDAGVNILVSGSYLFKDDMKERVKLLKWEKLL